MKNEKPYQILTPRLGLRQIEDSDLDAYHKIMSRNDVCKWLAGPARKNRAETRQLIERMSDQWEDKKYGAWGVFTRDGGTLIGHCGLGFLKETGETELKYAFAPQYWGRGYATEAAEASLEWAFANTDLERIIALSMPDNDRSINVINKLGFKSLGFKLYFGIQVLYFELLRSLFT